MDAQMPAQIDVLIIGAGPSGLMLSTWMARMGIKTRIIDRRFNRINSGQADGLQSRTFEILDSLGIGQAVWREANHMLEIRFWNPDEQGHLYRSDTIVDTLPGLSRFQQATLHQARIEDYLINYIHDYSDIDIQYGVMPESLSIDVDKVEGDGEYPLSVVLRHLSERDTLSGKSHGVNGSTVPNGLFRSNLTADNVDSTLETANGDKCSYTEKIQAKYVVGCDGAHSWTRRQIGSVMEGEQTDFIWGVLDIVPITDFPDIRYRCAIHSSFGSMMIIPRENKFVRMYIQITEVDPAGKMIERSRINPDSLLQAAQKILSPYKLTYKHCHWWTAYGIGQRVGSKFSSHNRVFLAGDAVHTHSPKAGQGMNISMQDTYNLGWKLAEVLKGRAHHSILETYVTERRQIAQELIEFDHRFSRLFSGRPSKDLLDQEGIDLTTFKQVFEKGNHFASGCAVDYAANMIVAKSSTPTSDLTALSATAMVTRASYDKPATFGKQYLAPNMPIGMRVPSYKVLNQSDARPWQLQELLPSNGSWRLLVFAGDILDRAQFARYQELANALDTPHSFYRRFTRSDEPPDSRFEIITIHSSPRKRVDLLSLPEVFHPFSEEDGWDYNKVFVDDMSYHEGHGCAYKNYDIDSHTGCVVIVRPDQYVSWIGDLEDVDEMNSFFGSFMKPQG